MLTREEINPNHQLYTYITFTLKTLNIINYTFMRYWKILHLELWSLCVAYVFFRRVDIFNGSLIHGF